MAGDVVARQDEMGCISERWWSAGVRVIAGKVYRSGNNSGAVVELRCGGGVDGNSGIYLFLSILASLSVFPCRGQEAGKGWSDFLGDKVKYAQNVRERERIKTSSTQENNNK